MTKGIMGMDMSDTMEDAAYHLKCRSDELEMFSWPESFGNTSGPHGGIGGTAITQFQVYAFRCGSSKAGIKYCSGVRKAWNGEFMEHWK